MKRSSLMATLTAAACGAALAAGCVPIREIRTEMPGKPGGADVLPPPAMPSADCNAGSATANENHKMIEDYGSYVLAFAEFDDQGWSYDGDRQLAALRERLQAELKA